MLRRWSHREHGGGRERSGDGGELASAAADIHLAFVGVAPEPEGRDVGLVATHVVALLQHDGVSELLEELLLLFTPLVVLIADYDRKGNRCATKQTDALQSRTRQGVQCCF